MKTYINLPVNYGTKQISDLDKWNDLGINSHGYHIYYSETSMALPVRDFASPVQILVINQKNNEIVFSPTYYSDDLRSAKESELILDDNYPFYNLTADQTAELQYNMYLIR